jgi:hypothetical protein
MRIGMAIKTNSKEDMEMRSFMKNTWMVAATLVVAAGTTSAQTLTAEIPFAFQAGSAMMAPGTYTVTATHSGNQMLRISRFRGQTSLFLVLQSDAPKAWVAEHKPKISFTCVERLCTLASVWDGESRDALVINSGARNRELAGATIVTLDAIKAD